MRDQRKIKIAKGKGNIENREYKRRKRFRLVSSKLPKNIGSSDIPSL